MVASVRRAHPADSAAIARLHRETISWGLLSQLGEAVVKAFYCAVTECPASFCFVAEQDSVPVGFAAGVEHWPTLLRHAVRRMGWPLLRSAPHVLAGRRWRKLWETGRYTQSGLEGVNAEFVSFGVREDAPARVLTGAALVRTVTEEFRRRGIRRFRGVVGDHNARAKQFFEAVGFRFLSQIEIHPGEASRTHVVDISPGRAD